MQCNAAANFPGGMVESEQKTLSDNDLMTTGDLAASEHKFSEWSNLMPRVHRCNEFWAHLPLGRGGLPGSIDFRARDVCVGPNQTRVLAPHVCDDLLVRICWRCISASRWAYWLAFATSRAEL